MNAVHDESHEIWIAEVAAGERDASSIPDCETCRREVAAMVRSTRRLAAAADEYRSVQKEAAALPESTRQSPAGRKRIGWGVVLLAVAAVIVLAIRNTLDRGSTPAPPNVSLGDAVRCEAPVGETSAFAEFRWAAALPPGGSFELEVRDASAGSGAAPALSRTLTKTTWVPTLEERGAMPRRIHWTVTVRDAGGAAVGRGSATASLSSH